MTIVSKLSLFSGILAATMGSLLAGYHLGIISGALFAISEEFHLSLFEQQGCVTILIAGALLGALLTGPLASKLSRKQLLIFIFVLFLVGMLLLVQSPTYIAVLIGRFIAGLGVGLAFAVSPLYIAEISPAEHRGSLVFLTSLAITCGIFIAYLVSYAHAPCSEWRRLISWSLVPLGIQIAALWHAPRAARPHTEQQFRWRQIANPALRKPLLIGIVIAIAQQLGGVNAIIFYGPHIFQTVGYQSVETALLATVIIGAVNVIATLMAVFLIDRLGRRPLLLCSLMGMALTLIALSYSLFIGSSVVKEIPAGAIVLYIAFFAIGLGPITWLLLTEIYPKEARAEAMGVAAFTNWLSNIFISLTFLSFSDWVGAPCVFFCYAIACLGTFWFVRRLLPETRGKTFEEIEALWKSRS
jgi:MFS family permease